MKIFGQSAFVAAAVMMLPFAAHAATITYTSNLSAGQFVSEAHVIQPGEGIEFQYNVLENLIIGSFAVSATGNDAGGDVQDIRFGFTSPATSGFTTITAVGTSAFGGGFLPALVLSAGDVFSVFFEDGITNAVTIGLSFEASAPSAIPLPATGALLGGVMGLFGAFAMRRRKTQSDRVFA